MAHSNEPVVFSDLFAAFAPTNDAFAALPEGTLASLLQPENKEEFGHILTSHIVFGKVLSTDVAQSQEVNIIDGNRSFDQGL